MHGIYTYPEHTRERRAHLCPGGSAIPCQEVGHPSLVSCRPGRSTMGKGYGSWRGTNVQSRANWPSMPLRLVTLPFKVPADRTSSATSSTTWSLSEVALQSTAQPSSASWSTSSFVRAKRVPVGAGDPASSKRVPGRDTRRRIFPGPSACTSCSRWSLMRSAAPGSGKGRRYPLTLIFSLLSCSRSEEHTSELQSLAYLVCRLLLEKKKKKNKKLKHSVSYKSTCTSALI